MTLSTHSLDDFYGILAGFLRDSNQLAMVDVRILERLIRDASESTISGASFVCIFLLFKSNIFFLPFFFCFDTL